GCAGQQRQEIEQRHRARAAQINARYDVRRAEAERGWNQILATIDEGRKYLVPIAPGSNYSPVTRVDADPRVVEIQTGCRRLSAEAQATESGGRDATEVREREKRCYDAWARAYRALLDATYYHANLDAVLRLWSSRENRDDLEALAAYSHNAAILA